MIKDQTCYDLNGLIEIFKFLIEKFVKKIIFCQNKNNWIYVEATKVLQYCMPPLKIQSLTTKKSFNYHFMIKPSQMMMIKTLFKYQ
jgi:hypothetical protein